MTRFGFLEQDAISNSMGDTNPLICKHCPMVTIVGAVFHSGMRLGQPQSTRCRHVRIVQNLSKRLDRVPPDPHEQGREQACATFMSLSWAVSQNRTDEVHPRGKPLRIWFCVEKMMETKMFVQTLRTSRCRRLLSDIIFLESPNKPKVHG